MKLVAFRQYDFMKKRIRKPCWPLCAKNKIISETFSRKRKSHEQETPSAAAKEPNLSFHVLEQMWKLFCIHDFKPHLLMWDTEVSLNNYQVFLIVYTTDIHYILCWLSEMFTLASFTASSCISNWQIWMCIYKDGTLVFDKQNKEVSEASLLVLN